MKPGVLSHVFLIIVCTCFYGSLGIAEDDSGLPFWELDIMAKMLKSDVREIIGDPETINRVIMDRLGAESRLKKFITKGNIKFKAFDSNTAGSKSSLGFSYDYSKDIQRSEAPEEGTTYNGLILNFSSKGNVAFDQKVNPSDFLDADISFFWFRSAGEIRAMSAAESLDLSTKVNKAYKPDVSADEREAILRPLIRDVKRRISTQVYTELSVDGGIESNQSFSTKQYYYGGHFALDIKAFNPDSAWSKFNFLDYPFAISRWIAGNDEEWEPHGSSLPTVLIGVDRVKPKDQDPRTLAGDSSDYTRVRGEVAFKTLVGEIKGRSTYFEANFRHYRELKPSASTKAAKLDRYTYVVAALQLPDGMFVSYANGRLPMDAQKDKIYELGFNYNF